MKALSLWQPWATLIAIGAKRVETRSWATSYRGPLAIHAAKRWDEAVRAAAIANHHIAVAMSAVGLTAWDVLPRGAVVATCELVDCQPTASGVTLDGWIAGGVLWELTPYERAFGDYTPGRYAWLLADVKPLPTPIPMRGAQGLFDLPGELAAA